MFNYKVNKDKKCGFPDNSFNKVINTLEDKKINYEIVYKDKNPVIKKYNKLNNYKKILTKAINYQDIKIRVERIIEKINKFEDIKKLEKIIGLLENEIIWRKI